MSLEEASTRLFARWASDWLSAPDASSDAEATSCTTLAPYLDEKSLWYHFSLPNLNVWFPLDPDGEHRLLHCILPSEESPVGQLSVLNDVLRHALNDLAEQVFAEAADGTKDEGSEIAFDHEPPPAFFQRKGSGCATVCFTQLGLQAVISDELVSSLSGAQPEADAPAQPLTPARQAAEQCRVTGAITLDLGTCAVEEVHALEPGDVIATQTPLTTAFKLHVEDNGPVAACRLGRRAESRAIVLEPLNIHTSGEDDAGTARST